MRGQPPAELVRQTYAAFDRGDITSLLDAMADDIEWDSRYPSIVPFSGVWRGHDGVKQLISTLGETIQVLAFEILSNPLC